MTTCAICLEKIERRDKVSQDTDGVYHTYCYEIRILREKLERLYRDIGRLESTRAFEISELKHDYISNMTRIIQYEIDRQLEEKIDEKLKSKW